MSLFRIDPFQPARGAPPRTLTGFVRWALHGAWPVVAVAGVVSALAGITEVIAALLLGQVIDAALGSESTSVFVDQSGVLLLSLVFFLLLRPAILGASAYTQSIMMQPNILNLTLSRLHRFTLGQSVTFFDDDFAGRIAQKEMQTARAMNDVVTEVVHTVLFALASVFGAVALLGTVDWRIAAGLVGWIIVYGRMRRDFMPRSRARSKARAASRAMITGQRVDTVTEITTGKPLPHAAPEE